MFTLSLCIAALTAGAALAQGQPSNAPKPPNTSQPPNTLQPPSTSQPPATLQTPNTPPPQPPRAGSQRPSPPQQPATGATVIAPAPAAPRRQFQPVNTRVDLSITDQRGGSAPIKRTLSVVVADGMTGSVRSQSEVLAVGSVPLNVDASPELLADGKIRLGLNVQYDWPAPVENAREAPRGTVIKTALHDSLTLILENDKPMIAAQSADPIGDRQVTVEVKATILR
jgi:hypothetical protein